MPPDPHVTASTAGPAAPATGAAASATGPAGPATGPAGGPATGPLETLLAAERFADQRRLRRGVSFWRIVAVVLGALLLLALLWRGVANTAPATDAPHIARLDVTGVIGNDERMLALIDTIRERESARALVVHVDSPGGTAVGGEAHFEALRKVAADKPVVAQVETLAASAGYMIAAAADHVVARNTSIVGSIGVIVQVPNVSGLLERIGVEVREIKSSPLKAEPSPFNEIEPADEAMMRAMVLDSYEWFVELVADRRGYTPDEVRGVADGSVFSGRQGLENGLIDAVGGEERVKAYLESRDIDPDLPVIRYEPPSEDGFWGAVLGGAARSVGAGLGQGLGRGFGEELGEGFAQGAARVLHPPAVPSAPVAVPR